MAFESGPPGLHERLFLRTGQPGQGPRGVVISGFLLPSEESWGLSGLLYHAQTNLLGLFRGSFQDTGPCWVRIELVTAAW